MKIEKDIEKKVMDKVNALFKKMESKIKLELLNDDIQVITEKRREMSKERNAS